MDEIHKVCKRRTQNMMVGYWNMRPIGARALLYADDIVLIADTQQKLQQSVTEWAEELKRRGMIMNVSKSKVMVVSRGGRENIQIMVSEELLEQVGKYEYLGTMFSEDGKIDLEVMNRVRKGSTAYYAIKDCIFGKREIEKRIKNHVYRSVIEPIMLYGSESWPIKSCHENKIRTVEMKCHRKSVGKTRRDRIRNTRIREEVGMRDVSERIEMRQLGWFGHIQRMGDDRKAKQYVNVRVQGKRTVGRPRYSYEDRIEEIGRRRGKSVPEMRRLAADRREWRRWIEATPTL
ncbi:uncharacterized protein LOC120349670 [Nilaparvata lugens]|uniref:uncharacterized protein LOC120349670 n=1 Tax=Nilaparvata lugens TaxID=108931 RepID=UPI00193DE6A6|nr:uncharacterized protein LOC120349670 [Nilaparvata lugens]